MLASYAGKQLKHVNSLLASANRASLAGLPMPVVGNQVDASDVGMAESARGFQGSADDPKP